MEARRRHRDLAPVGPLGMLERSLELARAGGLDVAVPAMAGGSLLGFAVLVTYYVERVEGLHSIRWALALALVLAWWGRAYLVGVASRRVARAMWDAEDEPGAGHPLDVLRTAGAAGLGLWVWSWPLIVATMAGVVGVVFVVPFFALRGAVAPSWIARSACSARSGWAAFADAVRDNAGRRVEGVLTEALILAGALGLAVNLYAAALVVLMLMRTFGGLELASIESFLSASNVFVLIAVAAVTLVLFEPLRAAHSAAAYVGARVRAEGLDLTVALEEAIRHSKGRARRGAATDAVRAASVLLAVLCFAPLAQAQQPPLPPPPTYEEPAGPPPFPPEIVRRSDPSPAQPVLALETDPIDREVQGDVEAILARPEFREFDDRRGDGLRDLIERLFEWMFRPREQLPRMDASGLSAIPLPGAWVFLVIGAALLLGVGAYLFVTYGPRREEEEGAGATVAGELDPRERAPRSFLDEAAELAERGDLRAALRALYLATLVALDRRRWIAFDPHLTNWQYLRQMPRGETRSAFRELTRLFDYKWYGEEDTTLDDYARCRELSAQIVEAGDGA